MQRINALVIGDLNRCGLAVARGLKASPDCRVYAATVSGSGICDFLRQALRSKAMENIHFLDVGCAEASFPDALN